MINEQQREQGKIYGALRRHIFLWHLLMFLVYNYYIIQAILVLTFPSFYHLTITRLLPFDGTLMILLALDTIFKVLLVPMPGQRWEWGKFCFPMAGKFLWYHMIKRAILFDVLVMVVYVSSYLVDYSYAKYMRLTIVCKVVEIYALNEEIYSRIYTNLLLQKIYTLIKMAYLMLLFSHYFGCIFYIIDQTTIEEELYGPPSQNYLLYYQMNMLCYTPIEAEQQTIMYLYGFYFMVSLISTIAYGDIIGKNPPEQAYVLVMMIIATICIAFILQQFMSIFRKGGLGLYMFIRDFNCLREYMRRKQIPLEVQNKVKNYLIYAHYEKHFHSQQPLVQQLTPKLRNDLLHKAYAYKFEILFYTIGLHNIYKLCAFIQEVTFQGQMSIYNPYQTSQDQQRFTTTFQNQQKIQLFGPNFMLLLSGKVEEYLKYDDNSIEMIIPPKEVDDSFNFYEFATTTRLRHGLRTIRLCRFIQLTHENFLKFLQQHPIQKKKATLSRQKILVGNLGAIGDKCRLCVNADHSIQRCPKVHYVIDHLIVGAIHPQKLVCSYVVDKRKTRQRGRLRGKKVINLPHYSVMLESLAMKVMRRRRGSQVLMVSHLLKSFTRLQKAVEFQQDNIHGEQDCYYDRMGLERQFRIEGSG